MSGDDEILVETAFRTFQVRVQRLGFEPPTAAQLADGRSLAVELRFALAHLDPDALIGAQRLFHALSAADPFRLRRVDARSETQGFFRELGNFLEEQFTTGRLLVTPEPAIANVPEQELTVRRPRQEPPPPETAGARRGTPSDMSFEVRFVDEIGQAIGGIDALFSIGDDAPTVTTNAAGVALLDGVTPTSAIVGISDVDALERVLIPRWSKPRTGSAPTGLNLSQHVFSGANPGTFPVKAVVPNTIVIKPRLGKIHLRLVDKWNRTVHANRAYRISGPTSLSGTTDEGGQLLHSNVPFGDYQLTLQLDDGRTADTAAIVLDPSEAMQVRRVAAVQHVELARLKGMFFETNKSFLLPASIAVFDRVRAIYERNEPSQLLIVGHTDTTAQPSLNDPLSLERANNTRAFLFDDVDGWLENYAQAVPEGRRWSAHEDGLMIESLPDFSDKSAAEDPVHWFQRTRNLKVDGIVGDKTRRELIKEYMGLDGASLLDRQIQVTTHGCGELFPLDDSQDEVDPTPQDDKDDQADRRVELFFFDPDFGIQPPPPGDNSHPGDTQYLEWRKGAQLSEQLELGSQSVEVQCVDESGAPLPNLSFQIITDTKRVITGTLDATGSVRVPIFRTADCAFSVQGVDETALPAAVAASDDSVVSAALLAAGIAVTPGLPTIITVGLAELIVSTDLDPTDDPNLQFTLSSSDGAFTQTLTIANGNAADGGLDLLFSGLQTVGKSYSLTSTDATGKNPIFQNVAYAALAGLPDAQGPKLTEPTSGDPDGRLSTLVDPSDNDAPDSSATANA